MLHLTDFIKQVPKAELHLHIEGSFQPELMFKIAQRNGVTIPYKDVEELRKAYKFSCLQDFLNIYYLGTQVLLTEQDFYELAMAYFEVCQRENIVFTEIMFDPQSHTSRGVPFATVIKGLQQAREDAEQRWGIRSLLIMSYLRHLSEEEAFETLEQSLPYKSLIHSVGLDSSECGNPPSKFQRVFEASAHEGYRIVAHAGEEGNADYVWEALELLNVARVDHGNTCLNDDRLVKEIVRRDLALTVCPLSNLELCVVKDLREHPIRIMLEHGLKATINSDDPAYFGGYLTENFLRLQEAVELTFDEVLMLVKNSFKYSFATPTQKEEYLINLENFVQKFLEK